MSQVKADSAKRTTIFSAIASFVGMMAAVPVSLAIFSAAQPAHAMQAPNATDAGYSQYMQAYNQGYLASTQSQGQPGGCTDSQPMPESDQSMPQATSSDGQSQVMLVKAKVPAPMSKKEWTQNVTNSYNQYMSTTNTKVDVHTKNINSNNTNTIGSNNTTSSSVAVTGNGAVVSNNTATNGSNFSHTDVDNVASNNTAIVNDSFNSDSHDKKIVVKDSGNTTTTTNNTAIVNDSFNKDDHSLNVNSGNTIEDNSTTVKVEDHDTHYHL